MDLRADGKIQWGRVGDEDARVCHTPATRMRAEMILLESPTDGTLRRRIRKADGSWTNSQNIAGTIEFESERAQK
jgi:hypothetical protein